MAIAFVQAIGSGDLTGDSASAPAITVVAGNFLVAAGATFHATAGDAATAPTITGGGTWTIAIFNRRGASGAEQSWIAFCPNATGGSTTVTCNPNGTNADFGFALAEFSGLVQDTTVEDVNVEEEDTSSTTVSIASGTLGQANELIVAVTTHNGGTTGITENDLDFGSGGYALLAEEENNSTAQAYNAQYKIVSSTASDTASWDYGAARVGVMCLATFKQAAVTAKAPAFLPNRSPRFFSRRRLM